MKSLHDFLCFFLSRVDFWRRPWQPSPVFLPGESDGQRSLAGYSSWGHQESIRAETDYHTYTCNNQLVLSGPLPQCPQLLPHGPGSTANVCHEIFLELYVLEDLFWIMAVPRFISRKAVLQVAEWIRALRRESD